MKKFFASVLVLFLLHSLTVSALAATSGDKDIVVSGKYVYTAAPGVAEAELSEGKYEAVVEGIPVTVTPNTPQNDLTLVLKIIPETHEEAHDWFGEVLIDHGDKILPMDIHFVDQDNNRVELHGIIRISVKIPEGFVSPIVCYVSDEGEAMVMDSTIENGYISWTTDHNSYYALVEKIATDDPTSPTEPSTPTEPTTPSNPSTPGGPSTTGDQSQTSLWMVALIVSGIAIIVLIVIGTRKKKKDD